jgi:aldehyde:ferredoxin oxidoreductase
MMLHSKGPLLTVDVGEQSTSTEDIDDILESFIGGRGVATKLAHQRVPFDADPLGPENRLYITSGPMQISDMSFTGRMNATGVSPLTNGLVSSNAGGFLSRHFTGTGYSAVEFAGESDELVAIHITDDGIEFEAVPHLEGATVDEVDEDMDEKRGLSDDQLIVAGPAGENLVRYASIMTTEHRTFGRGGLGAIMGSKNIKCVSFEGDSSPDIEIPEIQRDIHQDAATVDDPMKRQGTNYGTEFINDSFSLPTRYFEDYTFEGVEGISGDRIEEKKYKKGTCSACAFACKLPTRDEDSGLVTEGPEFETTMAFGSNSMVDDVVSVMKSNDLCDKFGLDTISTGNSIAAYLMANDEFGNSELIHELIEKIAYREGDGDILAEGIDRFADELGVKNHTVKGMDFAGHDARVLHGQGLSYAVANRGGDHMYARFYSREYGGEINPEGLDDKPSLLIEDENINAVNDSGIVCKFSGDRIEAERYEELFETDYESLLEVGNRIVTLERHFNNQRGFDRTQDTLPYEIDGLENAIEEYYQLRGWNQDGTVPDEQIARPS